MSDRNTNRGYHDRKKSQLPTNNYLSSIEGKHMDLIPKQHSKTPNMNRRHNSTNPKVAMRKYNLTVNETVTYGNKALKNKEFGIPDYYLKSWHHDI
jgi:hypothetical protein